MRPALDLAATLDKVQSLRNEFEVHRTRTAEYQAFNRRRIAALEQGKIQPAQKDRGKILRALLAANGGKMLAKDARRQMRLPKTLFSMLVKSQADSIMVTAAKPRMPCLLATGYAATVSHEKPLKND